jgi:cell division protein FtsI/penicillin-binding protein 2
LEKDAIEKILDLHYKWIYINNWNLYVNPEEIENRKILARKIAKIISFPEETVFYLIRKRKIKYIHILSKLSIDESSKLENFLKDERVSLGKWYIKEKEAISTFIILIPHHHRFYPENRIWSQIIWFVDKQWEWHYWVEWYYNEILKWEAWEIVSRKDIKWRIINPVDLDKWIIEREWAIIYTTINRNIQKNVEKILKRWVKKYKANKWSILIMDPKTWKIITMANYPSFDTNYPGEVYELEIVRNEDYANLWNQLIWKWVFVEDKIKWKTFFYQWKKILLRKATREELWNEELKKYKYKNDFGSFVYRNSIISDIYEPGSIMKAITMAIWIDSWEITRNTYYQNSWPIKIDQFPISDIAHQCRWYHTFSRAINYSCNVWMVRIAQKIWKALLYNYLSDFWFWKSTEITLDWEVVAPMKNYGKWSNAQLYTTSYWLWINVTQLQMWVAYSALANWGLILRPQIIDKIDFRDNKIIKFKKEIIRRAIDEKTSQVMIDVLVNSIEKWVAKNWKVEWYLLAWKTWTAQIAYKWTYEDKDMPWATNASFAWFWPAQDPKFVIIVKLVRPRTNNYWGLTSAYVFADVAKYLLNYYKIPKVKK